MAELVPVLAVDRVSVMLDAELEMEKLPASKLVLPVVIRPIETEELRLGLWVTLLLKIAAPVVPGAVEPTQLAPVFQSVPTLDHVAFCAKATGVIARATVTSARRVAKLEGEVFTSNII